MTKTNQFIIYITISLIAVLILYLFAFISYAWPNQEDESFLLIDTQLDDTDVYDIVPHMQQNNNIWWPYFNLFNTHYVIPSGGKMTYESSASISENEIVDFAFYYPSTAFAELEPDFQTKVNAFLNRHFIGHNIQVVSSASYEQPSDILANEYLNSDDEIVSYMLSQNMLNTNVNHHIFYNPSSDFLGTSIADYLDYEATGMDEQHVLVFKTLSLLNIEQVFVHEFIHEFIPTENDALYSVFDPVSNTYKSVYHMLCPQLVACGYVLNMSEVIEINGFSSDIDINNYQSDYKIPRIQLDCNDQLPPCPVIDMIHVDHSKFFCEKDNIAPFIDYQNKQIVPLRGQDSTAIESYYSAYYDRFLNKKASLNLSRNEYIKQQFDARIDLRRHNIIEYIKVELSKEGVTVPGDPFTDKSDLENLIDAYKAI